MMIAVKTTCRGVFPFTDHLIKISERFMNNLSANEHPERILPFGEQQEIKDPVMIEKIKEKFHIIVVVIITVYLIALATKTAHVIYTEHIKESPETVTEEVKK
ncbi:MAG: hypothetical protein C4522_11595 [Desulfobacteraceae bacterium]|nr:MAG: hypothetical protein C4522_11595 [Desulfobacteraceae bacterium]